MRTREWILGAAAVATMAMAGCTIESEPPTNLAEARDQAAASGNLVLIDFFTEW